MVMRTSDLGPADEMVPGYFLLKVEVKEKTDDDPRNSQLVRTHYIFCELSASVNFAPDGTCDGHSWMSQDALEKLLANQKSLTTGVAEIVDGTVLIGPGNANSAWTVTALAQSKQSFPVQSFGQSFPKGKAP